MKPVIYLVLVFFYAAVGAFNIYCAFEYFEHKKRFRFGLAVMYTFMTIAFMFKLVFKLN